MVAQIIGVTSYEKDKKTNFTIHCMSDFSDYEKDSQNAVGHKVSTVWTRLDCSDLLPGDVVDLRFEPGFNNTATLSAIEFIHRSDNPFDKEKDKPEEKAETTASTSPKSGK